MMTIWQMVEKKVHVLVKCKFHRLILERIHFINLFAPMVTKQIDEPKRKHVVV